MRPLGPAFNGQNPRAALIQPSDGSFYGTTYSGGASRYGTVFKMDAGSKAFSFGSPIVLQGDNIVPSAASMFNGNSFDVDGGSDNYGIVTIDPERHAGKSDNAQLVQSQYDNITGKGDTLGRGYHG